MERALISIVSLIGAFSLVGAALVINSTHFTEVVALCGPAIGIIIQGWMSASSQASTTRSFNDTINTVSNARQQAAENIVDVIHRNGEGKAA